MRTILLVTVATLALAVSAQAREMRGFNQINAPRANPDGMNTVEQVQPVSRELAEKALREVLEAWNKGNLESKLDDNFFEKRRLPDYVDSYAPRDAKIRLQSVQGVQTLQQFRNEDDGKLMSRISVTANTQVEFSHPTRGFQRLSGINEYILKVTH